MISYPCSKAHFQGVDRRKSKHSLVCCRTGAKSKEESAAFTGCVCSCWSLPRRRTLGVVVRRYFLLAISYLLYVGEIFLLVAPLLFCVILPENILCKYVGTSYIALRLRWWVGMEWGGNGLGGGIPVVVRPWAGHIAVCPFV